MVFVGGEDVGSGAVEPVEQVLDVANTSLLRARPR
jgi:hypothetical protein